jgi:methylated-DNA-[protein]-cysteine S-methyltransferase
VAGSLLLRCFGQADDIDSISGAMASRFVARHRVDGGEELSAVVVISAEVSALLERIAQGDLLLLPPITWSGGRVALRVMAFGGAGKIASLFSDMRLESKTVLRNGQVEDEMLASGLLLPSLTGKQGKAVLAALDGGYYESPRKSTAGEVASRMGVARSTFEEHLKAAESQIVRALAPLVRVRVLEMERGEAEAGTEALHLYSRFSEDLGLYVNLALREGGVSAVSLTDREPEERHGTDHPYLARIIEHLATGRDDLRDVPLDLPVSGFEREVLELLRTIPPGEVMTYGEIARRLGRPKAVRAVGNACAKNPAIVVVPCHRVVPSSGGVGNYSGAGGPGTKIKLLEKEGALQKIRGRPGKRAPPAKRSEY